MAVVFKQDIEQALNPLQELPEKIDTDGICIIQQDTQRVTLRACLQEGTEKKTIYKPITTLSIYDLSFSFHNTAREVADALGYEGTKIREPTI